MNRFAHDLATRFSFTLLCSALACSVVRPRSPTSAAEPRIEPQHAPAAPTTSATDERAIVNVRVLAKESGEPQVGLQPSLIPVGESRQQTSEPNASQADSDSRPKTDAGGSCEFVVEPGTEYDLWVSNDDLAHAREHVHALKPGERREIVLRIPTLDDLTFFGRVIDVQTRAPIAGASLRIDLPSLEPGGRATTLDIDSNGLFRMPWASWKVSRGVASAPDYSPKHFRVGEGHHTSESALCIELARASTIEAQVSVGSGAPVPDVRLRFTALGRDLTQQEGVFDFFGAEDWNVVAITNADGHCKVRGAPANVPIKTEILREGQPPRRDVAPLVLEPGEVRALALVFGMGATLSGRVEDQDGKPVARQVLWRTAAKAPRRGVFSEHDSPVEYATTNEQGRFHFVDVADGDWWIGPAPHGTVAPNAEFVSTHGESSDTVLLVDRGLYIRGRVIDPDGTAAPKASVFASSDERIGWASCEVDERGRFTLGPLASGRWSIAAIDWWSGHAGSDQIDADAGSSGILLELTSGARVAGFVLDGSTREPCEADVVCSGGKEVQYARFESWTSGARTFAFDALSPGTYFIVARTRDGKFGCTQMQIFPGESVEGLTVSVEPAAKLIIRHAGNSQGVQYECARGEDWVGGSGLAPGYRETLIVPPGELTISARDSALRVLDAQKVTIKVGETKEIIVGAGH